MKRILALFLVAIALVVPSTAYADDGHEGEGFLMRVTGDATVASGETIGSVMVIDGTLTVDGTVTNTVVVIEGTAIINGTVGGDITVISGTLDLRPGAVVQDVNVISSELVRGDGVTVNGVLSQRNDLIDVPAGFIAALSIYFWAAMTLAVVVAGVVFAGIGSRQLNAASQVFTGEPLNALVGSIFVWLGLPLLAVLAMLTVIGIPLGLAALVVLLPALWFLGYIVAGAWLGKLILRRSDDTGRPFMATTLGLVLLQLGVLVPVIGGLVVLVAGAWGAGVLTYMAYRAAGGKGFGTSDTAPSVPREPSLAT